MPKSSNVTKLPLEIQNALLDKLSQGHTVDTLLQYIHELGFDWVSRSSLGRYTKKLRPSVAKVREARSVAAAITEKLGSSNDEVGRANIELLQTVMLRFVESFTHSDDIDLSALAKLSRATESLAKAKKYDIDALTSAREEGAKQALRDAKKDITKVSKKGGISAEALQQIQNILG